MPARFVPLADVAETLSISAAQAYALVRRGDLRAIQVGGRGQWRVEVDELEAYIQRLYAETERLATEPADAPGHAGSRGRRRGGSAATGSAAADDA